MSESQSYELKKITFLGRSCQIVMQNENGPCPLISISNILLLRGTISIHLDHSRITFEQLNNLIANHLMESNLKNVRTLFAFTNNR
jgi:hypothetical protein